ncbi:MAG TPA: hypothetical protein VH369_01275 [Bryobacteraceae bacterium]|jgi:hypothetical protein
MEQTFPAVQQETNVMQDSQTGDQQDLNVYVQAARAIDCRTKLSPLEQITQWQQEAVEIAAEMVCSANERADFLGWLRCYGAEALFFDEPSVCPIFPDRTAPRTEAELDALEAKFDRRYQEATSIIKGRKCLDRSPR